MNWLESLFNIAPDGGNGVTELLILTTLVIGVAYRLVINMKKRKKQMDSA
jgi:hypothetical protein